jgi:hypothetical protein
VVDPTDDIGSVIELRDIAAKNGSGRLIPAHPELRQALAAYRDLSTGIGPIIRSERGGPMTPLSIVVWFNRALPARGFSRLNDRQSCNNVYCQIRKMFPYLRMSYLIQT